MSIGHRSEDVDAYSYEYEEYTRRLFEATAHGSRRENMSGESRKLENRRKRLSVRQEDYTPREKR